MSNHHPIIYGKASDDTINPLLVDSAGKLHTLTAVVRTETNLLTTENLTSLQLWGTAIDCLEYNSIRFLGIATNAFNIYGSIDDTNYYKIYTIYPDTNQYHLNQFNYMFSNPPRYIKIMNGLSANTITLDYSLMT